MTQGDTIGLILSYVYAFGLLFFVEFLGKKLNWEQDFTRKIIHIGAGMWIWGILYFFDNWYFGIIPFGTFIILNYLFYRQQSFKAMDTEESTPGTVYFAISITILFAAMWRTGGDSDTVPIAAAAIMAMTVGDAFASLIGKRIGKHKYTILKHTRSFEGSAAMFITGFIAIYLTLSLLPGSAMSPNSIVFSQSQLFTGSIIATITATAAESVSPRGTDNLFVPLLSALVMFLFI